MFTHPEYQPSPLMERGKETAEEATWYCQICGTIEPHQAKFNKRWFPGKCQCQIDEDIRKQKAEQRRHTMAAMVRQTYSWLGEQWSDTPLTAKTFDTFKPDLQQEAYDLARLFSVQLDGTFILHGSFGTGKTHLLAAICNEVRQREVDSRFTTAPKLFKAIQARIQTNEDYSQLISKAYRTSLLVIDDIDKAKISEFREEIYFDIIDERTKRGLPTAISTNRLADLANYVGGAVCSRLSIGQIAVEMSGRDYRMDM